MNDPILWPGPLRAPTTLGTTDPTASPLRRFKFAWLLEEPAIQDFAAGRGMVMPWDRWGFVVQCGLGVWFWNVNSGMYVSGCLGGVAILGRGSTTG